MTDLTDKWKKGEFIICNAGKCQYYYVQNEEQQEVIKTEYCLFDDNTPNWQILAPVPSYEKWKNLKSKLQLKETAYDFDTTRLEEENAQLKELLGECKPYIGYDTYEFDEKVNKLLTKIDEALK